MTLFNPAVVNFSSLLSNAATLKTVSASINSTILLNQNSARKGATIFNNSNANLYLELGSPATLTTFTVIINQNGYYEVPFNYTGILTGIWAAANGSALVREFV